MEIRRTRFKKDLRQKVNNKRKRLSYKTTIMKSREKRLCKVQGINPKRIETRNRSQVYVL